MDFLAFLACVESIAVLGSGVRVTLDYRTPDKPRATVARCVGLATILLGLALSLGLPLAISLAGIYWDSPGFILAGAVLNGLSLACAVILAATAAELLCDLRG